MSSMVVGSVVDSISETGAPLTKQSNNPCEEAGEDKKSVDEATEPGGDSSPSTEGL